MRLTTQAYVSFVPISTYAESLKFVLASIPIPIR